MKVLYLTHQYFPRHVGGTEVYTRGLVRHLIRAGHPCTVITCHEGPSPHRDDFHVERTAHEGVPVVEIHFNLSVTEQPARAEYDNPFPAAAVRAELERFRPDVVHVLHAMKLSGAAVQACVDAGVPVILTLCDFWLLCPRHTLLQPDGTVCTGPDAPLKCVPCLRDLHGFPPAPVDEAGRKAWAADLQAIRGRTDFLRHVSLGAWRIIALSHFQKRLFVANGYPATRIEVLEHGVDLEEDDPPAARQPGRLRRLGLVGSLVPHKGAHVLLEALAGLPEWDVECRVHGTAPPGDAYGERLREQAARDSRVQLLGEFAPADLGRVLCELDLLAVPALWYENNPLVVQAALRVGVPVLASRLGTLEEMLAPRGPDWLVEPGNVAAWTAALRRLAGAPLPAFAPAPVKTMDDNARELLAIYHASRSCPALAS